MDVDPKVRLDVVGQSVARRGLADSLRELIALVTAAAADDDELVAAREAVQKAIKILGPSPSVESFRDSAQSGRRMSFNPFDTAENPLAPPLVPQPSEPGTYIADFVLSPAYEGPPGRTHGGVVTGVLDHASGHALKALGILAMSVSLTVDLLDATPYGEPLRVISRVADRDGRKIWVDSELLMADGARTATSRTLMIEILDPPPWAAIQYQELNY